jgi:hypothetical protein
MEPDEMQPRPWHQRGQPMHELQRAHHQVRGAVAPRGLELELHLPGGVELHPLLRQRRPGDVTAQLFQPLAVVGFDPHSCLQNPALAPNLLARKFGLSPANHV